MIGAAVGSPFLFYLFLTPRFRVIAPVVALSHFAAVGALARGHHAAAVALVAPFGVVAVVAAGLVLRQYVG